MKFTLIPEETVLLNPLQEMRRRTVASEVRFAPPHRSLLPHLPLHGLKWQEPHLLDLARAARPCSF